VTGRAAAAAGGAQSFRVEVEGGSVGACHYPSASGRALFVFAHGAGSNQSHPFMVDYSRAIAARGIDVVTFNFLYSERGRGGPDKPPVLEACFRAVADAARARLPGCALALGGKSMGGRIATMVAAADGPARAQALVALGYPLHPPGRPDKLRVAHLAKIAVPWLIVQGERDDFGAPDELRPHLAGVDATLEVIAGGDHSFKIPKRDGDPAAVHPRVQELVARWLTAQLAPTEDR
jgi:predicted alpha/beta-hydrolase family hydrolase